MRKNKGITMVALVIAIVIMLILTAITTTFLLGNNGILRKAELAKQKTEESSKREAIQLEYLNQSITQKGISPVSSADFIQPWLITNSTQEELENHFRMLKRAGMDTVILQWIAETTGGKDTTAVKVRNIWYHSPSINKENIEYVNTDSLKKVMNVAENLNMKVYVGLTTSNDWWENAFEDENWRNKNIALMNTIIQEIYEQYQDNPSFAGWYYSFEMYTNPNQYYKPWSYMLNEIIKQVELVEQGKAKKCDFMVAPYISDFYTMTPEEIKNEWFHLAQATNFRKEDVICLQDAIGTRDDNIDYLVKCIQVTKEAFKEAKSGKIQFWLDVENYQTNGQPAPIERVIAQLQIDSLYAEKLAFFSYSHYYLPLNTNDESKRILDEQYRGYLKRETGKTFYMIEIPKGGSVYQDEEGQSVPVPKGFQVSATENKVKNGLVIEDEKKNQYVWIPVNAGILNKGYEYLAEEIQKVGYTRYIKSFDFDSIQQDMLPAGVKSDTEQIKKYKGFYVGRYACSYDYNIGSPRVKIQYNENSKASENFAWQYVNNDSYNSMLWNNINYQDAKNMAEKMASMYQYSSTVKTGLLNGIQWDTMLRWIHISDSTHNKIYDGRDWGNYKDAVAPATGGNYENGILKPSGSNENWKYNNIYDIAGNLATWTSEKDGDYYMVRSNSYNGNGGYGAPAYQERQPSAAYNSIGFRVVLYIE